MRKILGKKFTKIELVKTDIMELKLKFYKPDEKMPAKWKDGDSSSELLVKAKGSKYYYYAYYDFNENIWEDAASWSDSTGFKQLKDVEMWALIPEVGDISVGSDIKISISHLTGRGFVKDNDGNYRVCFKTHYLELIPLGGYWYTVYVQVPEMSHQEEQRVSINRIEFVHELENVFFALTGTYLKK